MASREIKVGDTVYRDIDQKQASRLKVREINAGIATCAWLGGDGKEYSEKYPVDQLRKKDLNFR